MSSDIYDKSYNQDDQGIGKFEDYLPSELDYDHTLEEVERKLLVDDMKKALKQLSKQERAVVVLSFGMLDNRVYSQKEIAEILGGVDRSYVSKVKDQAIDKLMVIMDPDRARFKAQMDFLRELFGEDSLGLTA